MRVFAMMAAALALSLAGALPRAAVAQDRPQEKPAATESPLTLTEAIRPDSEMLVEAVRMTPTQIEEFLAVSDDIAMVEVVDVSETAAGNEDLDQAIQERQSELELLRATVSRNDMVGTALEQAGITVDEVMAVQVIRGDVVEVVIYHRS